MFFVSYVFLKKSNCFYDFSNVFCFFMIVMINKIYNTEMLTHGEHWTNSDFAFIYFGVDFRIGVFLISGERKTNWTANFADISNCTNCCMMAGSEVSVMTYEQKTDYVVCVWGGQGDANVGASWSTNSATIFSGASGQQVTCIQLLAANN